jgi:hypothetical protein
MSINPNISSQIQNAWGKLKEAEDAFSEVYSGDDNTALTFVKRSEGLNEKVNELREHINTLLSSASTCDNKDLENLESNYMALSFEWSRLDQLSSEARIAAVNSLINEDNAGLIGGKAQTEYTKLDLVKDDQRAYEAQFEASKKEETEESTEVTSVVARGGMSNTGASCYLATALQAFFELVPHLPPEALEGFKEDVIVGDGGETVAYRLVNNNGEFVKEEDVNENALRHELMTHIVTIKEIIAHGHNLEGNQMADLQSFLDRIPGYSGQGTAFDQESSTKPLAAFLDILLAKPLVNQTRTLSFAGSDMVREELSDHPDKERTSNFLPLTTAGFATIQDVVKNCSDQGNNPQLIEDPDYRLPGGHGYTMGFTQTRTEIAENAPLVLEFQNRTGEHCPLDERIQFNGQDYRLAYFSKHDSWGAAGSGAIRGHYWGVAVDESGSGRSYNDSTVSKIHKARWQEESKTAANAVYLPC